MLEIAQASRRFCQTHAQNFKEAKMNKITEKLLAEVAGLHAIPKGAVSYRENGESKVLNSSAVMVRKKGSFFASGFAGRLGFWGRGGAGW